jgi:predicted aspartyl protease
LDNKQSTHGQSFTVVYNDIVRSLPTEVTIQSALNPIIFITANALWDTGASSSLIRPEIVSKLNLKPVSKTLIDTPTDKNVPSNVYLINAILPNKARILNIYALEGAPNSCDMLIGMDVISMGDFAVTNFNGKTVFSFRMPSMTTIDFCKDS